MLSDGVAAEVSYEYRDGGVDHIGTIRFSGVIAFRFRNEMHSAGFLRGTYNALVDVGQSEWLKELARYEPRHIADLVARARHFAVFFDSNGYFEVVAESFFVGSPREGRLDEAR